MAIQDEIDVMVQQRLALTAELMFVRSSRAFFVWQDAPTMPIDITDEQIAVLEAQIALLNKKIAGAHSIAAASPGSDV